LPAAAKARFVICDVAVTRYIGSFVSVGRFWVKKKGMPPQTVQDRGYIIFNLSVDGSDMVQEE